MRKAWRSSLSPVLLPRIWSPEAAGPMTRVCSIVSGTLEECKDLRGDLPAWGAALDALLAIADSPRRHLLRPQLVLLGFQGSAGRMPREEEDDGVLEVAAGVELHHLFTFIHDDVMDHAELRRSKPTMTKALRAHFIAANAVKSPETIANLSVIVGDVIQARAMDLFARGAVKAGRGGVEAWKIILDGAQRSGASQFEDVLGWGSIEKIMQNPVSSSSSQTGNSRGDDSSTIRRLLERHVIDKTAFQGFMSPLLAGIHIGGDKPVSSNLLETCTNWGTHTGVSYQILDDVSELILSPLETGKDSLRDMREGRLSVPLFLLREKVSRDEWKDVRTALKSNSGSAYGDRRVLSKLVEQTGVAKAALNLAAERTILAEEELKSLQEGPLREGLDLLCKGLRSLNEDLLARIQ